MTTGWLWLFCNIRRQDSEERSHSSRGDFGDIRLNL